MIWSTTDISTQWPVQPLSELTSKVGSGATPRGGAASYSKTGIPLIRSQNVRFEGFSHEGLAFLSEAQAHQLDNVTVESGDVLLNITGASIGRVSIAPEDMSGARVNQHVCIIRPKGRLLSSFLAAYLASPQIQDAIAIGNYGVTREALTKSQILEIPVPVPDLTDQELLISHLHSIANRRLSALRHLGFARRAIERFRQAVLAVTFSGRLTADWRENRADTSDVSELLRAAAKERREAYGRRYKEPPDVDESALPQLPDRWQWVTLAAVIVSGPQNGLYLPQSKYGSGSPILRIEDYQLDWSKPSGELKCVAATPGDRECYSLRKDDIVINRVNSPSHLGKALLVQDSNLPALFESNMMRISLVSSAAPPYVTLFLQSMLGRQLLTKNAKWAVNQASINQTDVKSTPIPLPPADEQLEIVRRAQELLTRAGHLVPVIDGAAMRLHRSDQATLGKAFRGELIPTGAEQELAEGAA